MMSTLSALLLAAALASPAPLDDETARAAAWQLAHEIMSPFCPGRTLAACPSASTRELRTEIERRFADGEAREAIVADLVARFGHEIRGVPDNTGAGMVLRVLPAAIGVGLVLGLIAAVGRRRQGLPAAAVAGATAGGAWDLRLDDELDRID